MSEVFREKVGENPEQRQTTDAVASENPCSTAFMLSGGSRGLLGRRNDRGPIFHAKKPPTERSWRTYVMRHARFASRRSGTICRRFYPGFTPLAEKNVIRITGFICKYLSMTRKMPLFGRNHGTPRSIGEGRNMWGQPPSAVQPGKARRPYSPLTIPFPSAQPVG